MNPNNINRAKQWLYILTGVAISALAFYTADPATKAAALAALVGGIARAFESNPNKPGAPVPTNADIIASVQQLAQGVQDLRTGHEKMGLLDPPAVPSIPAVPLASPPVPDSVAPAAYPGDKLS